MPVGSSKLGKRLGQERGGKRERRRKSENGPGFGSGDSSGRIGRPFRYFILITIRGWLSSALL